MKAAVDTIDHRAALRRLALKGVLALATFGGITVYWGAYVPIAGAVVTPGQLVVNHNVRKVQHPRGGIVGEILAREGDRVEAGQVVIRLNDTIIRAELAGVTKKIDELEARAARLEAEGRGYAELVFPASLTDRKSSAEIDEILATETALYQARKTAHQLRKERLGERIEQLRKEIQSFDADLKAKTRLAEITERELENLSSLAAKRLVTTQRMNALQRDAVTVSGQKGQLAASILQAEGRIVETEMQKAGLDDELRAETTKELRETQAELAQQLEKKAAVSDELQRIEIRSPISGRIHESIVHTIGGVITAAEPIMTVVPTSEPLELEVRLEPHDIDQIHVGQEATIRINAFNRRTTPEISGKVTRLSPDVSRDEKSGATFYNARLSIDAASMAKLDGLTLQAGMQAEALIKTSDRTALEYLTKPFQEQLNRAFRER